MSIEAVKFNDWNIPKAGRLDPFTFRMRSSSFTSFRQDGQFNVFGTGRKPVDARVHTVNFIMKKGCEEDLLEARNDMMLALLSGEGRLWFNTPSLRAPQMFNIADLGEIVWDPNRNDWAEASVSIDFEIYNSILYRPQSAGRLTQLGYTPVTIADNAFGESWDERVFASFTIAASPTTFTINNDGQLRTHRIIIRIESLGVNGFINPKIENLTTGQYFEYIGTGVNSSHFLQANAAIGPHRARLSTDAGLSFVTSPAAGNVWPSCNIDALQNPIMEFDPGANSMRVTAGGTFPPGFRVMFLWLPAYGMPA